MQPITDTTASIPVYELRSRMGCNYFEPVAEVLSDVHSIRTVPDDIRAFHRHMLAREYNLPCETATMIMLNQAYRIVGLTVIAYGDRTGVQISTDAIVTRASLRSDCTGFVIGHNHLHGLAVPSAEDMAALPRLLAELPPYFTLLDYIITARAHVYSFREEGLFPATCRMTG